jgi:hypothetical protein
MITQSKVDSTFKTDIIDISIFPSLARLEMAINNATWVPRRILSGWGWISDTSTQKFLQKLGTGARLIQYNVLELNPVAAAVKGHRIARHTPANIDMVLPCLRGINRSCYLDPSKRNRLARRYEGAAGVDPNSVRGCPPRCKLIFQFQRTVDGATAAGCREVEVVCESVGSWSKWDEEV